MTVTIEIRDIGRPPSANDRKGMNRHKYKRLREKWELRLRSLLGPGFEVPTPSHLQITVYSVNPMDWDGVVSCAKAPLDALQNIGALANDGPRHILSLLPPRQERCKRGGDGIRLDFLPSMGSDPFAWHVQTRAWRHVEGLIAALKALGIVTASYELEMLIDAAQVVDCERTDPALMWERLAEKLKVKLAEAKS